MNPRADPSLPVRHPASIGGGKHDSGSAPISFRMDPDSPAAGCSTILLACQDGSNAHVASHIPGKLQSMVHTGPVTIPDYERLQTVREVLAKEGVNLPMPSGN
jgi:hypothetical protein